jgi:hypothetical protein
MDDAVLGRTRPTGGRKRDGAAAICSTPADAVLERRARGDVLRNAGPRREAGTTEIDPETRPDA